MGFGLTYISGPAVEPISLLTAMAQAKVDIFDEQELMELYIIAAREDIEGYLRRALITQTLKLTLDRFPYPGEAFKANRFLRECERHDSQVIEIPRPPLQAILSIKYIDRNGVQQTMDPVDYQVDLTQLKGRVAPQPQDIWPYTRLNLLAPAFNTVEITYRAGYGDLVELVPGKFRAATALQFAHLYANREPVITGLRAAAVEVPMTVEHLCAKDRVVEFA